MALLPGRGEKTMNEKVEFPLGAILSFIFLIIIIYFGIWNMVDTLGHWAIGLGLISLFWFGDYKREKEGSKEG